MREQGLATHIINEHDGMYVYTPADVMDFDGWCTTVRTTANRVAPFDLKAPVGIDAAIKTLKEQHPEHPWDQVDTTWQAPEDAKAEFIRRVGLGQKSMDMLVATFVPYYIITEGDQHVQLQETYKQVPLSETKVELIYWNSELGMWTTENHKQADAKFRRSMQQCVASVLTANADPADCSDLSKLPCFLQDSDWLQRPVKQAVESFLDMGFYRDLNGEKTRKYWMYADGTVEFRDTHEMRRADRKVPMTLTCGYPYPGEAIAALQDVRDSQ